MMNNLTPLQAEFLDLLEDDPDVIKVFETEEEYVDWRNAIIVDIKKMNAAELRQNIKAFKETQS